MQHTASVGLAVSMHDMTGIVNIYKCVLEQAIVSTARATGYNTACTNTACTHVVRVREVYELTLNWSEKPEMALSGRILCIFPILTLRLEEEMEVSPHVISSSSASWMNTYCACVGATGEREGGSVCAWQVEYTCTPTPHICAPLCADKGFPHQINSHAFTATQTTCQLRHMNTRSLHRMCLPHTQLVMHNLNMAGPETNTQLLSSTGCWHAHNSQQNSHSMDTH